MASHPFILLFYLITGFINRLMGIFHKNTTEKNYFINKSVVLNTDDRILDDQNEKSGLKYGSKTFAHSGCGIAAVYNALLLLGRPVPLPEMIRQFEHHGASLYAAFGTAPQSAAKYLKSLGLEIKKTARKSRFPELAESSDIILYTIMNNRRRLRSMVHTMCIDHRSGAYIVHNSHGRCEKYDSFSEMMSFLGDGDNKASGVYMIGLTK